MRGQEDSAKRKILLIVDDEEYIRQTLATFFEMLGFRAIQASDGVEALEAFRRYDLAGVISDIRMPRCNGIELLKIVREANPEIPIFTIITAFADLAAEEAYDLGANAILAKPFNLEDLEKSVRNALMPREERWSAHPLGKIEGELRLSLDDIKSASQEGQFHFGRGGFFANTDKPPAPPGALVRFCIHFDHADLPNLDGVGYVRWVRARPAGGFPAGCGIEIAFLEAPELKSYAKFFASLGSKAFIPRK